MTQKMSENSNRSSSGSGISSDSISVNPSNVSTIVVALVNGSTDMLNDSNHVQDYSDWDGSMGTPRAVEVIQNVVLPIICACGILGIILTVIVLSHKNMCTSTNCYLMALAIADLLYLLLLATRLVENQLTPDTTSHQNYVIYMTYAAIFMHTFMLASIWLTVMLAVERYIAICHPFLAAKVCSVRRSRIIIVAIFVFAFLCRVVNFWEYKLMSMWDPTQNRTVVWHMDNPKLMAYDSVYRKVYPWIIDVVVASVLPFILLLGLNLLLIWEVRKSTRYIKRNLVSTRSSSSVVQREEVQITIMLISVIMVFFVCQAPFVIDSAIYSINKDKSPSSAFMMFRYIAWLLLTLKSAINFILYCWFSEKFWATLKRIVCVEKCLMRMNKNSQNGSYYTLRRYSTCTTRDTCI